VRSRQEIVTCRAVGQGRESGRASAFFYARDLVLERWGDPSRSRHDMVMVMVMVEKQYKARSDREQK
jgi:hypothetical protein